MNVLRIQRVGFVGFGVQSLDVEILGLGLVEPVLHVCCKAWDVMPGLHPKLWFQKCWNIRLRRNA